MKKSSLGVVTLATVSFLAFSAPVQAVTITPSIPGPTDFSVNAGETGNISYTLPGGGTENSNETQITVPGGTEMTLSYTLAGSNSALSTLETSFDNQTFYSQAISFAGPPVTNVNTPANPSSLAFISANLTSPNSGTINIVNNSGSSILFSNTFSALLFGGAGTEKIAFSVSSVPLPPALSMFGAGLLGLLGFGWMKRKQGYSAAA